MIAHHDIWLAVIALVIGGAGSLVEILQHRYAKKAAAEVVRTGHG